jgi:hypothetical protein
VKKTIIKALLVTSTLFSSYSWAEDKSEMLSKKDKPLLEKLENSSIQSYLSELSNAQAYIGGYVQGFGEGLDRFFGSEELNAVQKGSRLIVYTPFTLYDDGHTTSSMNFRAQIDLPRTNHRWKVLVSSFEGDEEQNTNSISNSELNSSTTQQAVDDSSQNTIAGRYLFNLSENTFSHIDMGLKFINYIEHNPYIKYKVRYKKALSESLNSRTTQNVYLERARGFALESQQVFDKKLNPDWLARSQTSATWWRDDKEVLVNQKGILFESVSPYRARAYFIDGNWNIDNQVSTFESVSLGMNWREQLYKDWLFAEVEPRVAWYEATNFEEPVYSLRFMLEMHFYALK